MTITFRPMRMISGPLRACVWVHVVARYDVNSHIRSGCRIGLSTSCSGHCRLAATIVEQIEVCVAEMAISYAVDYVVKARLGQSEPCRIVEHFVVDVLRRCRVWDGKHDAEWQPEHHERQIAVKVASDQREVGLVCGSLLKARLTHEFLSVDDDTDVDEEWDEKRK